MIGNRRPNDEPLEGRTDGPHVPQPQEDRAADPELHGARLLVLEHQDRPLVVELAQPRAPRRPARPAVLEAGQVPLALTSRPGQFRLITASPPRRPCSGRRDTDPASMSACSTRVASAAR